MTNNFLEIIDVKKLRKAFDYDSRNDWSEPTDEEVLRHLEYLLELSINQKVIGTYDLIGDLVDSLYWAKVHPEGIVYPQWKLWENYLDLAVHAVSMDHVI